MALQRTVISNLLKTLNNSQLQKTDNAAYQTIKNLIKNLSDVSIEGSANVAEITNIINNITASNTVEALDGVSDAGVSTQYSRGDHKHAFDVPPSSSSLIPMTTGAIPGEILFIGADVVLTTYE